MNVFFPPQEYDLSFATISYSMKASKSPIHGTGSAFFFPCPLTQWCLCVLSWMLQIKANKLFRTHPFFARSRSGGWAFPLHLRKLEVFFSNWVLQMCWDAGATASLALHIFSLCRWYCSVSAWAALTCFSLRFFAVSVLWLTDHSDGLYCHLWQAKELLVIVFVNLD